MENVPFLYNRVLVSTLRGIALVLALAALACPGTPPAPEVEAPEADVLLAGFLAKGLCSGLWVNHRDRDDFLSRDILLGREALERATLEVDEDSKKVTARLPGGAERTAVFHPTHGCTLLPEGDREVAFDTSPILPLLPDSDSIDWPMGDVVSVVPPEGVDPAALQTAVDLAFAEDPSMPIHTRAFLVVHRGKLIAERYAEGFDKDSVQIGWSMGKSVTSALVGVAVQKGWLELDQPAPIAEWQAEGDPRAAIRVRDLLRMSSGLDFVRIEPTEPAFFSSDNHHFLVYFAPVDVFRLATDRPLEHPPDTVGRYRNGDPLSLGRILREAAETRGESYLAFPQRELFDRIGARTMVLERDHRGNMILTGYDHGTPRDWARFGLLHLWDGVWMGERILPEGWVEFVSGPAPAWPGGNYGGLFWINGGGGLPGAPRDAYFAAGAFGQYVVILPSHDLVVVRMGYSLNSGAVRQSLGQAIARLLEALHLETQRDAA